MQEEEDVVRINNQRAIMMSAASSHVQIMEEEEESQCGGSSVGRNYKSRSREDMDERLVALYFTVRCRYEPNIFRN